MVYDKGEGFIKQIQDHLGDLLETHGFEVSYYEGGESSDRYLVIYQSPVCRIRFIHDRMDLYVSIGPLHAPNIWMDEDHGVTLWYPNGGIQNYLENYSVIDFEELIRDRPVMEVEEQLDTFARDTEPRFGEIIALFHEDAFGKWQDDYDQYRVQSSKNFNRKLNEWKEARKKREQK